MNCRYCTTDPTHHSFEFLSRLPSGDSVFYTCPAKGKQHEMKEDHIQDYVAHMDQASASSWIWVFDCSGLQSFQMPTVKVLHTFITIIQDRYRFVLKHILFINMNWKMSIILSIAKPFIKEEAKSKLIVANSKLELLGHGLDTYTLQKINK